MLSKHTEQMFGPEAGEFGRTLESRETYDDRLNHILEAATWIIARDGYEKATMRAVAKAAKVSLAGMYHYFESKERMLFLIQFRAFNSLLNTLKEKLHGVEDPSEQLRVMVRNHVAYFAANMAALKACSHELESLTGRPYEELSEIRHEYYELTRDIVDRIISQRPPSRQVELHVSTMCLFGMLNWLYRWYNPSKGRSPHGLANLISDQFLAGLHGPTAPTNGEGAATGTPS
jgi:AcrR family transcriptional regulator